MSATYHITRVTAEGEQITADINVPQRTLEDGGKAVHEYLTRVCYKPLDIRLAESGHRILDAMGFEKRLPPEIRFHVMDICKQVLGMIYGTAQSTVPIPHETVVEDQKAQIAELERQHAQAAAEAVPKSNVIEGPWTAVDPTQPVPTPEPA